MKKIMKKLTAALLALTCIPVTGLTASAEVPDLPWYFGATTWDAFEGLEPFDDHGMFVWMVGCENEPVYPFEETYSNGYVAGVIAVKPRQSILRFVLRDDVDVSDAAEQMAEVLDEYFPGLKDGLITQYDEICYAIPHDPRYSIATDSVVLCQIDHLYDKNSRIFELGMVWYKFPEDPEKFEAELLLAFAKRQLISEFYGFGETARYYTGYFSGDVLEGYEMTHYEKNENPTSDHDIWIPVDTDWDGIRDYLAEHYPGYTVEQYVEVTGTSVLVDGTVLEKTEDRYRIVPNTELTLREKLELTRELYDLFGIAPNCGFPESGGQDTTRHNALEQPGDVTLDCEIDIVDVIAANKALLGASTLCNTAQKNCDINGDGTPDTTDALAILKEVVGLTTNFAEP